MGSTGSMPQTVSSHWFDNFGELGSYQPSTYKSLDKLDDIPSLRLLKDLFWQEIRNWVKNDTNTISPVNHEYFQGSDRVYLGGMNHALNDAVLQKHNISAVITIHPLDPLARDEKDPFYGLGRYGTGNCPVKYHWMVPLEDKSNSNLIDHFDDTYHFIREQLGSGQNILIHCKSGRSRSVAVVIAFLQRTYYERSVSPQKLSLDEAWKQMRTYREDVTELIRQQRLPVIIIMERFFRLLELYELQLIGHPDYEAEKNILFPAKEEVQNGVSIDPEKAVDVKGGAAVLKICIAIVFYKNNQRPLQSVVQKLFELNEAYFYELEGSEHNGRSYVGSQHAYPGIIKYYVDFAEEYGIEVPSAAIRLSQKADGQPATPES
jgi:hypothetical protein